MHKIMLEKKQYARLILAVFLVPRSPTASVKQSEIWVRDYFLPFSIPADMNTIFYCISYKFRTGSHDDE